VSVDPLLVDTAGRLLGDVCSFAAVEAAEADGWADAVWRPLADAGFAWIGLPEAAGGSGGTLADACAVLRAAGARAAPVPLAETAVLAGWLLAASGLALPDGPLSTGPLSGGAVADGPGATGPVPDGALPTASLPGGAVADGTLPGGPGLAGPLPAGSVPTVIASGDGTLTGTLYRVPWGRAVARVVTLVGRDDGSWAVAAFDPAGPGLRVEPATNLAGEPRDSLHLAGARPEVLAPAGPGVTPWALELRGALTRAQLMAGALEAMSRLTVAYTDDRRQFGQPVSRFQAVQAHLVHGAQDAALALMAAEVAARQASRAVEAGEGPDRAWLEIASARVVAGEAAVTATRSAHQAHGAMGMTREYPLHHLSRRLWAWSREWGPTARWRARLGQAAHRAGADRLYPTITAGTPGLG
jgi:acyl-CoA dehydrogenase